MLELCKSVRQPLALLTLCLLAAQAWAAETELLLGGLRSPASVAAEPGPRGGLIIAESDARVVTYWRPEMASAVELVASPPAEIHAEEAAPTSVAFLDVDTFLVAWESGRGAPAVLAFYLLNADDSSMPTTTRPIELEGDAEAITADARGAVTSLSLGERFLYACVGGEQSLIVRARHNSGMLSKFKPVAEFTGATPVCCESPRGYLLVAEGDRLRFYDGSRPRSKEIASFKTGLSDIVAIGYGPLPRPAERLLYVASQQRGREGVYRVDAALGEDNLPGCTVRLIAGLPGVRAMTFGADGALYVVSQPRGSQGRLVRVLGEL